MTKAKIAQAVAVVVGAVTAVTLVSVSPVKVLVLAGCAGVYLVAPKVLK